MSKITNEVRDFFREIGRKNGKALYEKHGPEYFKKISAMRKTHGRQKLPSSPAPLDKSQTDS